MGRPRSSGKSKSGRTGPETGNRLASPALTPKRRPWSPEAIRETIESVATALILAFLFRTFIAEAFIIPTGSMATTLMGRHKDVTCSKCGYQYQVSASEEVNELGEPKGVRTVSGTCPICRFTMDVGPDNSWKQDFPSYPGDRIAASKSSYDIKDPQRWDVAVFHFPLLTHINYIKRVAGLPNESLRIQYGDVWVKSPDATTWEVARKPPEQILAVMQPVDDIDYRVSDAAALGIPPRWAPMEADAGPGRWEASPDGKSFHTDGNGPGTVWISYRHSVPSYQHWAFWTRLSPVRPEPLQPQLISDFNSYDTANYWGQTPRPVMPGGIGLPPNPVGQGLNWVGDLVVEFDWKAQAGGVIVVDLVKGGKHFLARLDLGQGTAGLTIPGSAEQLAPAPLGSSNTNRIRLAHVDRQLVLWLNGRVVPFDSPVTYRLDQVDTTVPTPEDLQPVRIGSQGAAGQLSHLRIFRDLYYVAQQARGGDGQAPIQTDFDPQRSDYPYRDCPTRATLDDSARFLDTMARFFSNPHAWTAFAHRHHVDFQLGEDQYLMLGDNSPMSNDSRLWDAKEFYVKRDLLIGEAVVLYWPHSWDRIPGTPIPLPFFPNVSRMGLVR